MQTKPTVVLMDEHLISVKRMAERLQNLAGDSYELTVRPTSSPLDHSFPERTSLLIVPESVSKAVASTVEAGKVLSWKDHSDPCAGGRAETVPRFAGMREIDRTIRHHLSSLTGVSPAGADRHTTGCHLSFSQTKGEQITRYVIDHEISNGNRIIYLPIKPLYLLADSFRRGPHRTVGDLLCLIASGDLPPPSGIGSWLYLHERGYFTFRLPDRADDLITCDVGCLKQLIHLVDAYAESHTEPTVAWFDTAGLPLNKLQSVAALCDYIYVDIPEGESSSARMARRELNLFLAALPPSCAILEHPADSGNRSGSTAGAGSE